ncbi:hypothetical protein SDC9_103447 [bioreactor metagenome]|uniref:Protein-export protein SecB n=2 Tax=root TaxID=1 RepID=A0A645AV39_9ZZZZ
MENAISCNGFALSREDEDVIMILEDLLAKMNIENISIPVYCYHFNSVKLKEGASMYYHFMIDDNKVSFQQKEKQVNVTIPYIFAASTKDNEKAKEENEEIFFNLDIEYALLITLEEEVVIDDDLKKALLQGVVPRILHPYFRHSVAESLQKAGLPQLNLPFFENVAEFIDA